MVGVNKNFEKIYSKAYEDIKDYGCFGSLSIKKRNELSKRFNNVSDFLYKKRDVLSEEQINKLEKIKKILYVKSEGGVVSNCFFKIFFKKEFNNSLKVKYSSKLISKFENLGVSSSKIPSLLAGGASTKTNKLLFNEHLYEQMLFFKHSFKFNENKEPVFKYTQVTSLSEELNKNSINKVKNKNQYLRNVQNRLLKQGVAFLEMKGEFENGCYDRRPLAEMPLKEFKKLIVQTDGTFNSKVKCIYTPTDVTIEELEEKDIIRQRDNGDYFINPYTADYTDEGFTLHPKEDFSQVRPIHHLDSPPKNFTLEIVIDTDEDVPSLLGPGHASLIMKTPNGEFYSFGFIPTGGVGVGNMDLRPGDLITPDNEFFMPPHASKKVKMTYELPDSKAFHQLMNQLKNFKGYHETDETIDSNLFYHPTDYNCALFAKGIRDQALALGAKPKPLANFRISNWSKFEIRIKEFFLNFLVHSPLGMLIGKSHSGVEEYAGIKNFNIRHLDDREFYLPFDLILDHMRIQPKQDLL